MVAKGEEVGENGWGWGKGYYIKWKNAKHKQSPDPLAQMDFPEEITALNVGFETIPKFTGQMDTHIYVYS